MPTGARQVVGTGRAVLDRLGVEAYSAATLLRRGALGLDPPDRLFRSLRGLIDYGPVGAALVLAAQRFPDRAGIVDERGALTFGELDRRSNALANALSARGFRHGQTIGVLCRNHRGMLDAIGASAKLGARTLLLNTDFSAPQLADVCTREDVALLIADQEYLPALAGASVRLGTVTAHTETPDDQQTSADTVAGLIRSGSASRPPRPPRPQQIVLLTSGTTGTPKGAPREFGMSLAIPGGYLAKIPLRPAGSVLVAAPIFHAWGLLSTMIALALGNTVVTRRRFDPVETLQILQRHRCDALVTVPILLSRLLEVHDGRPLDSLQVIAVSGSALPADLSTRAMDAFGEVLYNLYGSTEVAYASIATPADLRAAPGCVGRPPYGTEVRLIDADGRKVPAGELGRIFVGNSIQFAGYTGGGSKQVVDGLMSTGDVGHFDDAGRLFVTGRDDDMIISGGENVYPAEIEELLAAHPAVSEAAVVGVDDPDFGQRLRGYLVPAAGQHPDEEAIRQYVKDNLARFKVPREIVFVDALPRNPAGKVVKRELPGL